MVGRELVLAGSTTSEAVLSVSAESGRPSSGVCYVYKNTLECQVKMNEMTINESNFIIHTRKPVTSHVINGRVFNSISKLYNLNNKGKTSDITKN